MNFFAHNSSRGISFDQFLFFDHLKMIFNRSKKEMDCSICFEKSYYFMVSGCHSTHKICYKCSTQITKCPFCRVEYNNEKCLIGPSKKESLILLTPDIPNIKFNFTSNHRVHAMYRYTARAVRILGLPEIINCDYAIKWWYCPIKTVIEISIRSTNYKLNLLQYSLFDWDEFDDKINSNGSIQILWQAFYSLWYGIENDIYDIAALFHQAQYIDGIWSNVKCHIMYLDQRREYYDCVHSPENV